MCHCKYLFEIQINVFGVCKNNDLLKLMSGWKSERNVYTATSMPVLEVMNLNIILPGSICIEMAGYVCGKIILFRSILWNDSKKASSIR